MNEIEAEHETVVLRLISENYRRGFSARKLTPWVPNWSALDACGASENVS
jgi:hypothetical protein